MSESVSLSSSPVPAESTFDLDLSFVEPFYFEVCNQALLPLKEVFDEAMYSAYEKGFLEALQQLIDGLQDNFVDVTQKYVSHSIQPYHVNIVKLKEALKATKLQLSAKTEELEVATTQASEKMTQIQAQQRKLSEQQNEIESLKKQLTTIGQQQFQQQELEQQLQQQKQQQQAQQQELEKQKQQQQIQQKELEQQLQQQQQQIQQAQQAPAPQPQVAQPQQQPQQNGEEIEALKKALAEAAQQMASLSSQISSLSSEVSSLSSENARLTSERTSLTAEATRLSSEYNIASSDNRNLSAEITHLLSEVSRLSSEVATLSSVAPVAVSAAVVAPVASAPAPAPETLEVSLPPRKQPVSSISQSMFEEKIDSLQQQVSTLTAQLMESRQIELSWKLEKQRLNASEIDVQQLVAEHSLMLQRVVSETEHKLQSWQKESERSRDEFESQMRIKETEIADLRHQLSLALHGPASESFVLTTRRILASLGLSEDPLLAEVQVPRLQEALRGGDLVARVGEYEKLISILIKRSEELEKQLLESKQQFIALDDKLRYTQAKLRPSFVQTSSSSSPSSAASSPSMSASAAPASAVFSPANFAPSSSVQKNNYSIAVAPSYSAPHPQQQQHEQQPSPPVSPRKVTISNSSSDMLSPNSLAASARAGIPTSPSYSSVPSLPFIRSAGPSSHSPPQARVVDFELTSSQGMNLHGAETPGLVTYLNMATPLPGSHSSSSGSSNSLASPRKYLQSQIASPVDSGWAPSASSNNSSMQKPQQASPRPPGRGAPVVGGSSPRNRFVF